eukprot:6837760-Prymnesium_polylepis.1
MFGVSVTLGALTELSPQPWSSMNRSRMLGASGMASGSSDGEFATSGSVAAAMPSGAGRRRASNLRNTSTRSHPYGLVCYI